MTFKQIQDRIMERMNLSSTEARTRIKEEINERYRRLQTSVSLEKTRWVSPSINTVAHQATLALTGVIKITTITIPLQNKVLDEITIDTIREWDPSNVREGVPTHYAVILTSPAVLTVRLYPVPSAIYALLVDGLGTGTDLSADGDIPAFPEDFHDTLIFGVLADEYERLDRMEMCEQQEGKYQRRLSELRYWISKSAHLKLQQGEMEERDIFNRLSRWTQ